MKDAILLIVGAVLGVVTSEAYRSVQVWRMGRLAERRAQEGHTGILRQRTLRFYVKSDRAGELYATESTEDPVLLPLLPLYLSDPIPVSSRGAGIFRHTGMGEKLPVSSRSLSWLRRRGVNLFDGKMLAVVSYMGGSDQVPEICVSECDYYAFASLSVELEREMRWPTLKSKRLHRKYFRDLQTAMATPLKPRAVGVSSATVLRQGDRFVIPIARRSAAVVNNPGIMSVMPTFGLESNCIGVRASQLELLTHNLAREFAEEFFDLEEVIHSRTQRRADPDWMLTLEPVRRFVSELEEGNVRNFVTGLAVDPNDGSLLCSMLCLIESAEFGDWLAANLSANWESSDEPVRFYDLFSDEMVELMKGPALGSSTIFTLDRARLILSREDREY